MKPETFNEAVEAVAKDCTDLLLRKQGDYGHGNILAFGEVGVLVRVHDKVARLRNLLMTKKNPTHESIDDSWADIANYAIIAIMVRKGIFELPLKGGSE